MNFEQAFEPYVKKVTDQFIKMVENHYRIVTMNGDDRYTWKELTKLSRDFGHCHWGDMWRQIRQFVTPIDDKGEPMTSWSYGGDYEYALNEKYLKKIAEQYGKAQVSGFIAKLNRKTEGLDNVSVKFLADMDFLVVGEFDGNTISIQQTTVFKISKNGVFFNQWPARIYVNGNFMSEKKFKEWKNA